MGPHFSVVGVGQEHGTRRGDADQRAVGALRDQALARPAQPSSGAGSGWSGPGVAPPDPRLAGAPRVSHESHAPHRGRSSGRSFNLPEGRLSKSVAKAPIGPERRRRIVDIPRFFSRPIRSRGAFATDLDKPPPEAVPRAPHAPPRPAEPVQQAAAIPPVHCRRHQSGSAGRRGPESTSSLVTAFPLLSTASPLTDCRPLLSWSGRATGRPVV